MPDRPIYLDYNATTPIDPAVVEAMLPYLREHFGNPSSDHAYGERAHAAVERARAQVAALLGVAPTEVIFTGGGSEANNLAIKGVAYALRHRGDHLITSAVEHPAVIEPLRFLARQGYRLTVVPVDGECGIGIVPLEHDIHRLTHAGERRIVEGALRIDRCEARRDQHDVALAQGHIEFLRKQQHHLAAWLRAAGLEEAEMPRGDLGLEGEMLGVLGFGMAAIALLLLPFLDRGAADGRSSRLVTLAGVVALAYMVVFTIYGYLAA